MKKTIFLLFLILCFSFSINESVLNQFIVNNSITAKIKIDQIICPKMLLFNDYEYCIAVIEFIPQKTIHACTFSNSHCTNLTLNTILAYVHPTIEPIILNDSIEKTYNKTLDADIYKINKIYLADLKLVGDEVTIMRVEREEYNFNIIEIIVYLLILGISYYIYKLKK